MLRMFNRNFFMLNVEETIAKVTDCCEYPCRAMKKLPKELFTYQTETKPQTPGISFNADVLQESCKKILLLRDNLTSYTEAMLIKDKTKSSLRNALIIMTSKLRIEKNVTVRVDAHSTLKALEKDKSLDEEGIYLDIGSAKNKNKNAVAEKAIRELREELVRQMPAGGPVSEIQLAKAVQNLNFRIRHTGCSAKELWTKRNQTSGQPLHFTDAQLSDIQYQMRTKSHQSSAKYESRNAEKVVLPSLKIGDRVYVKSDISKSKARDQYLVLQFVPNKNEVYAQKLTDKKNKRNVITIQIQNLYKVNADDSSDDLDPNPRSQEVSPDTLSRKPRVFHNQKLQHQNYNNLQCFHCVKMQRKRTDHDAESCSHLNKIRPKQGLIGLSTSESESDFEEANPIVKTPCLENETHQKVLNDTPEEGRDIDQLNSQESQTSTTSDEDQDSVIRHNGNCCPEPRSRLSGTALPGRPIERRIGALQPPLHPPQRRLVQPGEILRYFTGYDQNGDEVWLRATVRPMTKKLQMKHPNYYNVTDEKGKDKSIELMVGGSWEVMRGDEFVQIAE